MMSCGCDISWRNLCFLPGFYTSVWKILTDTLKLAYVYLKEFLRHAGHERSFSKIKIIKVRLLTAMTQFRLSSLAIISIESDFFASTWLQWHCQRIRKSEGQKSHWVRLTLRWHNSTEHVHWNISYNIRYFLLFFIYSLYYTSKCNV